MMCVAALLWLACICACATGGPPIVNSAAVPMARQAELRMIFDRVATANTADAEAAASELAAVNADEWAYVDALWGTRSDSPLTARRMGAASLARPERKSQAVLWYRRALKMIDAEKGYLAAAEVRLELARALHANGDTRGAVELLANRVDPRPLSADLAARYEAMLNEIASAK